MPAAATKPPLSEATGAFGQRIRSGRLALNLSQEELAELCDLHWSYVGQVERGQNNLTLHNILRFAEVLDVDAGELVTGLPAPPIDPDRKRARLRRRDDSRTPSSAGPFERQPATLSRPGAASNHDSLKGNGSRGGSADRSLTARKQTTAKSPGGADRNDASHAGGESLSTPAKKPAKKPGKKPEKKSAKKPVKKSAP